MCIITTTPCNPASSVQQQLLLLPPTRSATRATWCAPGTNAARKAGVHDSPLVLAQHAARLLVWDAQHVRHLAHSLRLALEQLLLGQHFVCSLRWHMHGSPLQRSTRSTSTAALAQAACAQASSPRLHGRAAKVLGESL